ncbi:TPA: hypothetical protein ACXJF7_005447, partial [Burkholderia sola]
MYYVGLSVSLWGGDMHGSARDGRRARTAFRPSQRTRAPDALNLREFCIAAPGPTPGWRDDAATRGPARA